MIRQRSRPMPTSLAQGFRSMQPNPNMPQVPNRRMGRPNMPMVPSRNPQMGTGLAGMSPEQLKALRDRQQPMNPEQKARFESFQPNAVIGGRLTHDIIQNPSSNPARGAMKKGGVVKKVKKASSASKKADGIAMKGKTKGRFV